MTQRREGGLTVERRFTGDGGAYQGVEWETRNSRITDASGETVFEMDDIEVPTDWSQTASDVLASKYFRKAGVPPPHGRNGGEFSARSVFDRLAETWRHWGNECGYFDTEADADAFCDEIKHMLARQMAAPNSPQWFNTGLRHKYGITGTPQGFWFVDDETGEMVSSPDAYTRPAPHACFIQSVADDLVNEGGIMDLWVREARLFKMGSGTGSNFSNLRAEGETLAGGGRSSGLMSFLKIGDRAAGAIKSGGTTRRAAKMVILDVDHPDIEAFIAWKKDEEDKARLLIEHGGFPADFNGEAYATVSGQNSNNSVRVTDEFLKAVEEDGEWQLTNRVDGKVRRTVGARGLWNRIAEAAWSCADPGVQFHTTVNDWHTCPAGGEIRASNPCSEYMFLDDTACNLASVNLVKFWDPETRRLDMGGFEHAVRLWTIVLEISVAMAHFPSRAVARGSRDYRTLGLGYANLGGLLMRSGVPYDSDKGRAIAASLSAVMTGEAYATSAEMAAVRGPFPKFAENREAMLRVIRNHRAAAYDPSDCVGVSTPVAGLDAAACPPYLLEAARRAWDRALDLGQRYGYRNAQATVLAPTGTIGLVMDCDTTGIEPDYALVKFKRLAGGGNFTIVNQAVSPALSGLGYSPSRIAEITEHIAGGGAPSSAPLLKEEHLPIFDCAGDIHYRGHIGMMAAVQPFVSGAISKTINMPAGATPADVAECYRTAWKSGLKAVAVYRDGSKASQPLSSVPAPPAAPPPPAERVNPRFRLPARRSGWTQEARVGGHKVFLRTGEYEDGTLGEVFLDLAKEGATLRGVLGCFAIAVSKGLQYGVPLEEFVETFSYQTFEPRGVVEDHPNIKTASSIIDYVFRALGVEYLKWDDLAQVAPARVPAPPGTGTGTGTGNKPGPGTGTGTETGTKLGPGAGAGTETGPACLVCGHMTIRSGVCYSCLACGETTGCG